MFRAAVQVREIAPAAARDQYLFANAIRMLQDGYPPATLTRLDSTHQSRGSGPNHQDIKCLSHHVC